MKEAAPFGKVPAGWVEKRSAPFDRYVGPFYFPEDEGYSRCGFLADERHANTRDLVHGGMISCAFDLAMGSAAFEAAGDIPCTTIDVSTQFVSAMKLGEFGIFESETVRVTKSLVFLRATLLCGGRVVAVGQGVWKILRHTND